MPTVPSKPPGGRILPLALLLLLAADAEGSGVSRVGHEPLRPSTRSYDSTNGEYRVKIKPRDLLPARAVVARRRGGGRFEPIARFRLLHPAGSAFVSNDGALVVTAGFAAGGEVREALAVYPTGSPDRAFVVRGLHQFVGRDNLQSTSPFLDEARGHLVFGLPSWSSADCRELAVDLATGAPVTPLEDVLPQPRVEILAPAAPPALEDPAETAAAICGQDATRTAHQDGEPEVAQPAPLLVRVPGQELLAAAVERPLPYYTEVAQKARYAVDVTAEVVVSEHGRAMCVRTTKAELALDRSVKDVLLNKWKFEPLQRDGRPVRAVGTIVVRFEQTGGVQCRSRIGRP